ncbi:MAG: hypothetical protein PHG67_00050 [Bacteroidales bacterium]|jgi:hypothetical protein|nr:hypothetical protein [Bacteroidales bacterium]HOI31410.1 hypothetical protein [Bacteroidales bacterium]
MKDLITGLCALLLSLSIYASDSLPQNENQQYRKIAPSTMIQFDSIANHPLLKGFSALNVKTVKISYQRNSYLTDSLIIADSANANFWNKILYGTKSLFVLVESDSSYAMALFSPIALAIILLIMIPLLFRLFFVRLKLSTPSLPENFTEQVDDHNQVEEDDSQNQKTTAS